jgi:hypothetical protein
MPLNLKKDDMGDVIKDFYKSKAPQFKGKSKKKRREMAIAAKLTAERGPLPEYYGMPGGMGSSASKKLRADYDDEEYLKRKSKTDRLLAAVRRGRKKRKEMSEESNPRIPRKKGQPANSKKHSDLYTDENPKGTIHGLGFKDVATAKASVSKIRNSSRSHAHKIQAAVAMEQRAREMGKTSEAAVYRKFINSMKKKTKKMNEGWSDKYKKSIDCNNPKGFSQRAHCQGKKKKVSEATKYDRYDKEKKKHAADDKRMKFGKFYDKAKEAKSRLRPGEVKRYDKELGRYVSNKE